MDDPKDNRISMETSDRSDMESRTEEIHELLDKDERDVEAQSASTQTTTATPLEYTVSTSRKLTFLGLYFLLNLSVTLSNKALLRQVRIYFIREQAILLTIVQASYPWLLTFSHTLATSIGCTILLATGQMRLSKLTLRENLILIAFSALFTVNIAISNVSLSV